MTNNEATLFMEQKLNFVPIDLRKTDAPSVVNDVLKEMNELGFNTEDIFKGFIHAKSTIDLRIQGISNIALEKGLEEYEKRHPQQKGQVQGSFVVLAGDGKVLAIGGGRNFYNGRSYKYSD